MIKSKFLLLFMTGLLSMTFLSCKGKDNPFAPLNFDTFRVQACIPGNGQTGVNPGDAVTVIFTNEIKMADIEKNFSLSGINGRIEGQFIWIAKNAFQYIPRYPFILSDRYVVEVSRNLRDVLGNTMAMDFISDFYIGSDFVHPVVVSSSPPYTEGGITIDPDLGEADPNHDALEAIVITFSKPMNKNQVQTSAIFSISPSLAGYFDAAPDNQVVYRYITAPEYGKQYIVSIAGDALDLSGNSLGREYMVSFKVGQDAEPPVVASISDGGPAAWSTGAVNEGINKDLAEIHVRFTDNSNAMNRVKCESAFSISPYADGHFNWVNDTLMVYCLDTPLQSDAIYQIKIDTDAEDVHGLKLNDPYLVLLRTNGSESANIVIGSARKSNDEISWEDITDFTVYPIPVDMGPYDPANPDLGRDYYFEFQFTQNGVPVAMDRPTIYQDNFSLITLTESDPYKGYVDDIAWVNDGTDSIVRFKLVALSNKRIDAALPAGPDDVRAQYRFIIKGGQNGVKDANGNAMVDDFTFEFKEN